MSRYQGWEQPNEPRLNAAPYPGDHDVQDEHYRQYPACRPDRSGTVIAVAAGALSGFTVGIVMMTADVWLGWIG